MSDLFVAELLILLLLVPVLVRPFFQGLQYLEGLSILPAIDLLLCLGVVVGMGPRISFLPLFLFVLTVFFLHLPRMVRFLRSLPTDWFPLPFRVFSALLCLLFLPLAWLSLSTAPEGGYMALRPADRVVSTVKLASGSKARLFTWTSADLGVGDRAPVVLIPRGSGFRTTSAQILAGDGYRVIEADMGASSLKRFLVLILRCYVSPAMADTLEGRLFPPGSLARELYLLGRYVRATYGEDTPLYALIEGDASGALQELIPGGLIGDFHGAAVFGTPVAGALSVAAFGDALPSDAGSFKILALTAKPEDLFGYGEIGADDPLAAQRLGGSGDLGRKKGELAARRLSSWFSMRRLYEGK